MSGGYRCYSPSFNSNFRSCVRLKKNKSQAVTPVWYVTNRQIHEDLGVPLFADHIRALTESFDSMLADVGNPP